MTYRITSRFLEKEPFRSHPHTGYDFAMPEGTPIRSIKDGIVHLADYGNQNAGKTIFVQWEDGKTAIYGHLSKFAVKEGQYVKAGDLIGYSGNTGHSTGSHLHFGLKGENGQFIDPSPYIDLIQNMNNPHKFQMLVQNKQNIIEHVINKTSDVITLNGEQFIQMMTNSSKHSLLNFISSYIDQNTFFMQIMQKVLQFIAAHSSFLYDIIRSIF